MDIIFEFVGEFLIEVVTEITFSKKISKWIRYPLLILLYGLYAFLIVGLFFLGLSISKDNVLGGGIVFGIDFFLLICIIVGQRKIIKDHKKREEKKELV